MSTTELRTETEAWVNYHDGGIPGRRRVPTGKAAKQTFNQVPKIDCRDIGFFYAVNHGVDEDLLADSFGAMEKYFALPKDVKMETHNQKSAKFRGYEGWLEGKLDPSTQGGNQHPFPIFLS
jgi:isopenicillin N synthase-like dioxygenase